MPPLPITHPRRIRMRLRDYFYQYCQPSKVSAHQVWCDGYDQMVATVVPSGNYTPILYYQVVFMDGTAVLLHKDVGVTIDLLPGTVSNP